MSGESLIDSSMTSGEGHIIFAYFGEQLYALVGSVPHYAKDRRVIHVKHVGPCRIGRESDERLPSRNIIVGRPTYPRGVSENG
jgi:hypothetical protein